MKQFYAHPNSDYRVACLEMHEGDKGIELFQKVLEERGERDNIFGKAAAMASQSFQAPGAKMFVAFDKKNPEEILGFFTFMDDPEGARSCVTYIHTFARAQGISTVLYKAASDYALKQTQSGTLYVAISDDNTSSVIAAEKNGYEKTSHTVMISGKKNYMYKLDLEEERINQWLNNQNQCSGNKFSNFSNG